MAKTKKGKLGGCDEASWEVLGVHDDLMKGENGGH